MKLLNVDGHACARARASERARYSLCSPPRRRGARRFPRDDRHITPFTFTVGRRRRRRRKCQRGRVMLPGPEAKTQIIWPGSSTSPTNDDLRYGLGVRA